MIYFKHDTSRLDDYQRWELESYIIAAYKDCELVTNPIRVRNQVIQEDNALSLNILCKNQYDAKDLFQALENSQAFEFLTLRDCEVNFNYSLI